MKSSKLVTTWGRWSRDVCRKWTAQSGAKVIADHDVALARTRTEMDRVGAYDSSVLAGFLMAMRFVSGDRMNDGPTKQLLMRKLMIQAGLVAEVIENAQDALAFDEIVRGLPAETQTPDHQLVGEYSCNGRGEVWPVVTFGHTPLEARQYLQGTTPELDAIVQKVLQVSPGGGRFEVTSEGVFLSRDLSQVA